MGQGTKRPDDVEEGTEARTDTRLNDWIDWLNLTSTPNTALGSNPLMTLQVHGGHIKTLPDPIFEQAVPVVYAAFDDHGPVYVGQTTQRLTTRIRHHFGNQHTTVQQHKAGTWVFIVAAAFDQLPHGGLDRLERSAADWLLPLCHRTGRRHPRRP